MEQNFDEIVISGVAGRFPECENVEEFCKYLFEGNDLVTENDRRFKPGLYGLPKRSGTILGADKFDNLFFGIPPIQVNSMDVRHRLLLEVVYESIVDAGINPQELRGTKTGVYVAISFLDASNSKEAVRGPSTNIFAALAANRISYTFDLKGPSFICDTACSSSFYSLVNAFKDLQSGEIDNAIVASANLNFQAYETLQIQRVGILSPDGVCKTFSTERNGYVRSEAVVSLLLQKKQNARRIYASVVGAKLNADGYKKEGPSYPSSEGQVQLMKELYSEFCINIDEISYFETHGTGTVVGDTNECRAVATMFSDRREPLLIGAVKSNMGHAEVAAGLCSVVKALLTIQTGNIPADLHFHPIDNNIPGIGEGKLKVVTENTKLQDGLIGINSFGVGGANGHVVLKPYAKSKSCDKRVAPRLILVSGRTLEAVDHFFDKVVEHNDDEELFALIDEIYKSHINGHIFRGYMVIGDEPIRSIEQCVERRPICFVYPGLGSQWKTMGCDLLKIPLFRKTFDRCASAVKPFGIDLYHLVTSNDDTVLTKIWECYLAINSIQIALTDVLSSLGITPDYFLGHSAGEQACAYVNGGMSPEEAILLSYSRGLGFINAKKSAVRGQMAAVGLSKVDIAHLLPKEVYVACHNSPQCVTVSGPEGVTKRFVSELQSRGVYVKDVDSCGIALHTKYINEESLSSLDFMKSLLKNPHRRSKKWISTSVQSDQETNEWAHYNSPEYHYNNTRSTVLFDEALKLIPDNAIVVEMGPHALFQSTLKKELCPNTTIIPLMSRRESNIQQQFLSAIGKIYTAGGQPYLRNLYEDIKFPVSARTPMISPMVKWDHSISWYTPEAKPSNSYRGTVVINLSTPEYSHILSNEVDGRILMLGSSYVVMLWRIIAEEFFHKDFTEVPIIIEKLTYKQLTILSADEDNVFDVQIMKSGYFEIQENGSLVVTGYVKGFGNLPESLHHVRDQVELPNEKLVVKRDDFYKHFSLRGQQFGPNIRKVLECDVTATFGKIEWFGNVDCFLETVVHLSLLRPNSKEIALGTFNEKVIIDPETFLNIATQQKEIFVSYDPQLNITRCAGVKIVGLETSEIGRNVKKIEPVIEKQEFVYYRDLSQKYSFKTGLSIALQIVLQNCIGIAKRPKICELISKETNGDVLSAVKSVLACQPLTDPVYHQLSAGELQDDYDIILTNDFLMTKLKGFQPQTCLTEQGFMLYISTDKVKNCKFDIIFECATENCYIYLLRPFIDPTKHNIYIKVSNTEFSWLETLKNALKSKENELIHLYSEKEDISGIVGLIKCLCTEEPNCRATMIGDDDSYFDANEEIYRTQIMKNLTINVLRNGKWGTFVHFPLDIEERIEVTNATVFLEKIGDLASSKWMQSPTDNHRNNAKERMASVFYSGVSAEDVLRARGKVQTGKEHFERVLIVGHEFSGTCGERRIMGLVEKGGISLQLNIDPHYSWEIPNHWSLQDAATVPVAYSLGYYALTVKCRLHGGESILVYTGGNPMALAGINIAQEMECTVFVLTRNETDKKKVQDTFPLLDNKFIGLANDEFFGKVILDNTRQEGVDYVLNYSDTDMDSFSKTKFLSRNGDYLEFRDVGSRSSSVVSSRSSNYSYHKLSINQLFDIATDDKKRVYAAVVEGLQNGTIKPLPTIIFRDMEIEFAFKHVESEQKLEKVLIELREETNEILKCPTRTIAAKPKLYFNSKKSYVIIGGTGGVGLELTDWMIRRGATKIILNSRSGITTGYQALCLQKWSKFKNVSVKVYTDNTTTQSGAEELIQKAAILGPVGGIFHLALVLRDYTIRNQTAENFDEVLKPKVASAINLDTISRRDCPNLDYFVVYSSVTSGRGNGSQTNYGMANSAMERLCEKRSNDKLPGLAIQWGPIGGVGIYETAKTNTVVNQYVATEPIGSTLTNLEKIMLQSSPVCGCTLLQKRNIEVSKKVQTAAEMVSFILGIKNYDEIDKSFNLAQLGLDSLMTSEVKHNLYRNFHVDFSLDQIRDMTLAELAKISNK